MQQEKSICAWRTDAHADVSIVGEINPDLILYGLPRELPEEREILASGFAMTLGGSSAILAHNLALLGSMVRFSARIGPDVLGEMCCKRLAEAGVDLRGVVRAVSGSATGVTVILPITERRRILTFPGTMFEMTMADIDLNFLAEARHFHLSSLFLHRGLLKDIPSLFRMMKQRGLSTSLDTNDDPENRWGGALDEVLASVDVLFCTERELLAMTGLSDLAEATQKMAARLPLLVVKRGALGAWAYTEGHTLEAQALRVTVADTVGAGDTFDAGFLHKWVRGSAVETCLAYGNLAAGFSVTRSGGTEAFHDTVARERFFADHWRDEKFVL